LAAGRAVVAVVVTPAVSPGREAAGAGWEVVEDGSARKVEAAGEGEHAERQIHIPSATRLHPITSSYFNPPPTPTAPR
jgi:hypothetical protein